MPFTTTSKNEELLNIMMSTNATSTHGADSKEGRKLSWHSGMTLSPTPTWTPAPDAVQLTASEDDISPTSSLLSPSSFSFTTPRQCKKHKRYFFSSASTIKTQGSHGYLAVDQNTLAHKSKVSFAVLLALFWMWGGWSWCSFYGQSRDPIPVVPPSNSPSHVARLAFAKLYKRDFGAEPALWIMLDASTNKRVKVFRQGENPHDSHSFTDDTSVAYEEGKHFCQDLADYLEMKFQHSGIPSVRITSYYSLQDQGLDYVARHQVTPDGSKTIVKVEYLPDELGPEGVLRLKKSILSFGDQNQPAYLDVHYTGRTWSGPHHNSFGNHLYTLSCLAFPIACLGLILQICFDTLKPSIQWLIMTSASMATTLSSTAILWAHVLKLPSSPTTATTLVALSILLSVYFSKLKLDAACKETKDLDATLAHCGGVLTSIFAAACLFNHSAALQSVSVAAVAAIASSVAFHALLAPHASNLLVSTNPPITSNTQPKATPKSRMRSVLEVCCTTSLFLFVAFQSRRTNAFTTDAWLIDPLGDAAASSHYRSIGEIMGHGQMAPYRILFDGHKRNQSMVSLNGYDIVQMVVDELRGISLSDSGEDDTSENSSPGLDSGSTHVGESFAEVQHLIKNVVHHLKRLREEQQRQFDLQHQRRQDHWKQQQEQDGGDIEDFRCDNNLNRITTYSGVAVLENLRIPQSLYSAANICRGMEPRCPSEALHLLNVFEDETTTSDHLATFVTANLDVDPFSSSGRKWLKLARETLRRLQADPRILGGVEVHIAGPAAEYHDRQDQQQTEKLWRPALAVAAVTTLALAVSLGGVLAAIGSLIQLSAATIFAFGATVLIYEDGVLDWTRVPALSSFELSANWLDLPMFFLLAAAWVLLSDVSMKRGQQGCHQSLASSRIIVSMVLSLLTLLSSTPSHHGVHWPVLVVLAMYADVWIRRSAFAVLTMCPLKMLEPRRQKGNNLRPEACDRERENELFLRRFDELLKSPQAP